MARSPRAEDALRELAALDLTHRVEIEAPAGLDDGAAAAAFARGRQFDCVAVAAPVFSSAAIGRREPGASLSAEDPGLLAQARAETATAVRTAAAFRAPLVTVSAGTLVGSDAPGGARRREQAVERLCRELSAVIRAEPGLRLALRVEAAASALLDAEAAGWILEELPARSVGLALDVAAARIREERGDEPCERWDQVAAGRLSCLYLSDCVGLEGGMPLGTGSVNPAWIARLRGRGLPAILKVSGGALRLILRESIGRLL
ncbi:MAG: TIM barrel protein [Planctomycetota bacterium]